MALSDFFVPCSPLIASVFVSFIFMCWFFQVTYIRSLKLRILRLERLVKPTSHNTTSDVAFQAQAPRPSRPSRFMTVERKPRPEYL